MKTRKHLLGLAIAVVACGLFATSANADIIWHSNDMETSAWFGSQSTDQAHSPTHSAVSSSTFNELLPNWNLPSAPAGGFDSFIWTLWIKNGTSADRYKLLLRFTKPNNSESGYSQSSVTTPGGDWTKITYNITNIVNNAMASGYTKLHRIAIDPVLNSGGTYYVDDVAFTYTVPEPASGALALLGLGALAMLPRRKRKAA